MEIIQLLACAWFLVCGAKMDQSWWNLFIDGVDARRHRANDVGD